MYYVVFSFVEDCLFGVRFEVVLGFMGELV